MPSRIKAQTHANLPALLPFASLKMMALGPAISLAVMAYLLVSATSVEASLPPEESKLRPSSPVPVPSLSLQGQAEPAPPNPLIYLDIWLFGGLILLVALIVAVKYLWKALQPDDRDPSEGLQPWERPDYDDE